MKIGLIGDTHIPGICPVLSARVGAAFKGLDIILHVGDICELYVLEEFQESYTLTFAVAGDGDSEEVRRYLEEKRIVRFGQRQIGMLHGHQFEAQQRARWAGLRRLLRTRTDPALLPAFMLDQFAEDGVDAIVFGHSHQPYVKMHGSVLLFNPGAAMVMPGHRPTVGVLEMGERNITGKIVYL